MEMGKYQISDLKYKVTCRVTADVNVHDLWVQVAAKYFADIPNVNSKC